jgi:hypothetical protein
MFCEISFKMPATVNELESFQSGLTFNGDCAQITLSGIDIQTFNLQQCLYLHKL